MKPVLLRRRGVISTTAELRGFIGGQFGGELPKTWLAICRKARAETAGKHGGIEWGGRKTVGKRGGRERVGKHGGGEMLGEKGRESMAGENGRKKKDLTSCADAATPPHPQAPPPSC
jgi:hypothetical protein